MLLVSFSLVLANHLRTSTIKVWFPNGWGSWLSLVYPRKESQSLFIRGFLEGIQRKPTPKPSIYQWFIHPKFKKYVSNLAVFCFSTLASPVFFKTTTTFLGIHPDGPWKTRRFWITVFQGKIPSVQVTRVLVALLEALPPCQKEKWRLSMRVILKLVGNDMVFAPFGRSRYMILWYLLIRYKFNI